MTKVTIHAAKTNLSKLIAQVEAGGEVVICRGVVEVARLVAAQPAWGSPGVWDGRSPRRPGQLKGIIGPTPDDAFDPMTDEEIADMENNPIFPSGVE